MLMTKDRRTQRRIAMRLALAGLCGVIGSGAVTPAASAQAPPPAAAAPPPVGQAVPASWRRFAEQVQGAFATALAQDGESQARVRALLDTAERPRNIIARVWATPIGTLERLELEGVDGELAADLRAILMTCDFGSGPPLDMPQPLRLRLAPGRPAAHP